VVVLIIVGVGLYLINVYSHGLGDQIDSERRGGSRGLRLAATGYRNVGKRQHF